MELLKKLPIRYIGELHDIRLINFSIAMEEAKTVIDAPLPIRNFNERAMISMVDVKLKNMHPAFIPEVIHFDYRHIAFRVLMDDSAITQESPKGIYFHRAFTTNPVMVVGGSLLTNYNLEMASIEEENHKVILKKDSEVLEYKTGDLLEEPSVNQSLYENIAALDRAYSRLGNELRVTKIQRKKWPIQQVENMEYKNNFFETTRFEGAFRVFETIYYQWLPPKPIKS